MNKFTHKNGCIYYIQNILENITKKDYSVMDRQVDREKSKARSFESFIQKVSPIQIRDESV